MGETVSMRSLGLAVRVDENAQPRRPTTDFGVATTARQVAVCARLGLGLDQFVAAETLALVLGAGELVAFAIAVLGAAGRSDVFTPVGPEA